MASISDFRSCTDAEWLEVLIAGVHSRSVCGLRLPALPPEPLQSQFVGSANESALREAHSFYDFVKKNAAKFGSPIAAHSRFLDFGTGWGRFLRFAWKDVEEQNLFGVDIDPDVIAMCVSNMVPGTLKTIDADGRLDFMDHSVDIILAYSVFTHLPELTHLHWMKELKRVTRQGAIVALTIEPRRFLEFVASLDGKTPESGWHAGLQRFSGEANRRLPEYDSGRFIYFPTGGGKYREPEIYGDAICPIGFIEANWSPEFTVRTHIDDPSQFWQAAVILQRS
jgi:Methyltransferase domain